MANDVYRTIGENCTGLFKEKGSKFYAFAYPIVDEDEAKQHIKNLRRKYHNARHHCFAYKLGQEENSSYRVYDDGEPSGTAGKPIFGRIISAGLTNILIVVVRYFGGTLLGTSGLIRAYRSAAEDCLKNASIVECTVDVIFTISFQYEQLNKVMHITNEGELKIHSHDYGNECQMELSIRQSNFERISKLFLAVEELKLTIN